METETSDWLTAEYVQKILRNYEKDNSILLTSLTCEPATAKGDNYGSIMIRAKVEYSRNKLNVESIEKRSLIIKCTPMTKGARNDLLRKIDIFGNEIKMMETTLEEMNDILKENDYRFNARILHTQIGDPSVLVMEDLTPLGYCVANRLTGLDFDHCFTALQGLAKFHASSVALYEKDPSSMAQYNIGSYHSAHPPEMKAVFTNAIKQVAKEVGTWDEMGSSCHSYSEKLSKFVEVSYEKTAKVSGPKDDEFNVLNHGDFWVTNVLFRYDENGKVNGHIFTDFQMPLYSSPAIDLLYFFASSISEDVELNHRDVLIEKYLYALTSTMQRIGCRTKPPTMAELRASMRERELYGLMTSCSALPIILFDKKGGADIDGLVEGKGDNPMYKGIGFRKRMIRRLSEYDSRGLFDV